MSTTSEREEVLGNEFWSQPDALRPEFSFIYIQFCQALREEVRERGGSALEYAIVERLAFSYAYLRQRESDGMEEFSDRNRREMNKDFLETTMALRKMWGVEDTKNATESVLRKVNKAIADAMKDMPLEEAQQLQGLLANSFEASGL